MIYCFNRCLSIFVNVRWFDFLIRLASLLRMLPSLFVRYRAKIYYQPQLTLMKLENKLSSLYKLCKKVCKKKKKFSLIKLTKRFLSDKNNINHVLKKCSIRKKI